MVETIKINLIDVGASVNLISPWKQKNINYVLSFDPIGDMSYIKKSKKNIIYKCAIFDKEGFFPFYVCSKIINSSLFEPNFDFLFSYLKKYPKKKRKRFDISEVKKIKCIRLDTIIKELKIDFDFIKIDVQGAEMNVLKSLGKYLNNSIVGIHIELHHKELYKGIFLYSEVNNFLKKQGFKKIKILDHRKSKIWNNFLYIRKDKNKINEIKIINGIYKVNG